MLIDDVIDGTFIKEANHRFICYVLINDVVEECYVPNSSKVSNYLRLKNKQVLLTLNKNPNVRTKYSLLAVKYRNTYIFLNLNLVNAAVEEAIEHGILGLEETISIKREKYICGYKADLLIENEHSSSIIVEVKAVISPRKETLFPQVYSQRFINQLHKLKGMLQNGQKVYYVIVSLSPFLKKVRLNNEMTEYYRLINECLDLGLVLLGYNLRFIDNKVEIKGSMLIERL